MGTIREQLPVKAIIGVLTAKPSMLPNVYQELTDHLGSIDYISELLPFDSTSYYDVEMGKGLQRQFISFKNLIDAGSLADQKLWTNQVEQAFAQKGTSYATDSPKSTALGPGVLGRRSVNLDIGYICLAKLVLASTKDHAHRIYLRDGIYAEMTLRFYRKTFQPWEWTYPDYRSPAYINIFNQIRTIYMEQIKYEHQANQTI